MFFSVSKQPDPRFPYSEALQHWWFSHDAGWTQQGGKWSKGYRYQDLDHGNYCELVETSDGIMLHHDLERSFPLWWDQETKTLTNCVGSGQRIWTDRAVRLTPHDIELTICDIIGDVDLSPIGYRDAVDQVLERIKTKFYRLTNDPVSKKIFVSGGVDTLGLYSILTKMNLEHELVDYEFFQYDSFCNQFIEDIRQQHWAYQQIHHWHHDCYLISGACGDEYLFRGPATMALWMAWHDIDFMRLLDQYQCYHNRYFRMEKNARLFQQAYQQRAQLHHKYATANELARHLIDMNLNDHQHWHLGLTLTWTPYKDIELFKLLLRVPISDMMQHFLDASINREIIGQRFSSLISTQKNHQSRRLLSAITA